MIKNNKFNCCGCAACAIICPYDCLNIDKSEDGFFEPKLINDKCIECNLCEKICPMFKPENFSDKKILKSYSGYSLDEQTRNTCSSGGIGYEIAKDLIEQNYIICSVRYNYSKNEAEHYLINTINELEESKGSKYIQSNCFNSFENIFDGKKYAVFGTPCQISGLKKIAKIKNMEDKFIFIDFFCHGVPSYLLWDNYLTQSCIGNINRIDFRNKINGWHSFTLKISSEKKVYYKDKDKDKDLFYQFFLGNKVLNKCCYECKFKLDNSFADIRIGDMWGNKYSSNKEGISGILTFTEKGDKVLSELKKSKIVSEKFNDVIEGQIKKNLDMPKYRDKILLDLKNNKNLKYLYFKYIVLLKIKNKFIRLMKGI